MSDTLTKVKATFVEAEAIEPAVMSLIEVIMPSICDAMVLAFRAGRERTLMLQHAEGRCDDC